MDTKKVSNMAAPLNSAGNTPESNNQDEKEKARVEASIARDKQISNFASAHNSLSINASTMEVELEDRESVLAMIEDAIEEKMHLLNSSGKFAVSGLRSRLTSFQKTKLRNEIRNLIKSKKTIKSDISQLERSLSSSFRSDTNRIVRANVRKSAKKSSYHNRFGGNVKAAITKLVVGLSSEDLKSLKTNVAKSGQKKGDSFMMQALLKAPRHLLTKVAANSDARKDYMQHFRNELKVGK